MLHIVCQVDLGQIIASFFLGFNMFYPTVMPKVSCNYHRSCWAMKVGLDNLFLLNS